MRRRFKRFYSLAGERLKQNYSAVRLADGTIKLIESDTTDIQDYIQSFAESCSIEHILSMCTAGDTSVLSRVQGAFIDTTNFPKTFRDILDVVIDGRAKFESLPLEIKQKFGNDFEKWFSEAGSENWLNVMGFSDSVGSECNDNVEGSVNNAES